MSKLYAEINESARKTKATARGHNRIAVVAASWNGCIRTRIWIDSDGVEQFEVVQDRWHGAGECKMLARGVVGKCMAENANG